MIILPCGRDQRGLNAHSVDPDSMRIESWSSVDRPLVKVSFGGRGTFEVLSPPN